MVWQKGVVPFAGFIVLFLPALVNWLVPAATMSLAGGRGRPRVGATAAAMGGGGGPGARAFRGRSGRAGGRPVVPVLAAAGGGVGVGRRGGVGRLGGDGLGFGRRAQGSAVPIGEMDPVFASPAIGDSPTGPPGAAATRNRASGRPLQTFRQLERVEWDTLMFF